MEEINTQVTNAPDQSKHTKHLIIRSVIVIVGVLFIQLALAACYLYAFHAPKAKDVPIAVVGQASQVQTIVDNIKNQSDGAYTISILATRAEAEQQIKERKIYSAYIPSIQGSEVLVATATSKTLSQGFAQIFAALDTSYQKNLRLVLSADPLTAAQAELPIVSAKITDLAALPDGDTNGLAMFYTAFAFVFGGYLVSVALNIIRGDRKFFHRNAILRLIALAIFSVVSGFLVAILATKGVHALPDSYLWKVAGIGALAAFGVSTFSSALISIFGTIGAGIVILLFVVLGTPASGGPMPILLTGEGPWRWIAPYLPTGASLDAIRQTVYFDNIKIMQHLWVLIGYAAVGTIGLLSLGLRNSTVSFYEEDIKHSDE